LRSRCCAEPETVILFRQGLGEHGHLGSHGLREFDGEEPESAHADHGHRLSGASLPVPERE